MNQRSDNITGFRINKRSGELTFTGDYIPVGSPAVLVFTS
jgi:6-phosphogluconolactonase (cycloisomerase 2 family)